MTKEDAIRGLRREGGARTEAEEAKRAATVRLRAYIQAAYEAGVSISQIAREAGVSRQGVYDFLSE